MRARSTNTKAMQILDLRRGDEARFRSERRRERVELAGSVVALLAVIAFCVYILPVLQ